MHMLEETVVDDNEEFTLLWINLLEHHGAAADFVNQLEENDKVKPVDRNIMLRTGADHFRHQERLQQKQQRKQLRKDAVRGLQAAMKTMSELLSSVEEIIRQRILRSPSEQETHAKRNCNIDRARASTTATTAGADKGRMSTGLEPPLRSHTKRRDSTYSGNSLDDYLDGILVGDDDPAFVDSVRGWDAPAKPVNTIQMNASTPEVIVLDGPELHDAMMKNNIRFASMHAQAQLQVQAQTVAQAHSGATMPATPMAPRAPSHSSSSTSKAKATKALAAEKKAKKRKLVPSVLANAPSAASLPTNAPRRYVREAVANLTAVKVLQTCDHSSVCEYLVEWKELEEPVWVQRRQCAAQGKEVIDKFNKVRISRARKANRQFAQASAVGDAGDTAESEDDDVYIVDKIVGHEGQRHKKQYLVKWDGYESSDNTWEAAAKLQREVPEIVDEYEKKVAAAMNHQQQQQRELGSRENGERRHGEKDGDVKESRGNDSERVHPEVQEIMDSDDDDDVEIVSEDGSSENSDDDNDQGERSALELEGEIVVVGGSDSEDG